jgi:hypothetical protein
VFLSVFALDVEAGVCCACRCVLLFEYDSYHPLNISLCNRHQPLLPRRQEEQSARLAEKGMYSFQMCMIVNVDPFSYVLGVGVCLQLMVDGLARIMCMNEVLDEPPKPDNRHIATESTSPHRKHSKERKKIKCPELKYNKFQAPAAVYDYRDGNASSNSRGPQPGPQQANYVSTPDKSPLHNQAIESDIREIKRILRTYITRLNEKDAQGKIAKEWRIVARVLDRLFFFMYVSTIIVSLATIFPKG